MLRLHRDLMPAHTRTETDLLDFVDTAAIGLHWVAADGTILWANRADYEPLGYAECEYIGHNITEFHADDVVINDILRRLSNGERLQDYDARLRCKNGSKRNVRITSSVKFDDEGRFVHTRCFTVDVTNRRAEGLRTESLLREIERLALLASKERGLVDSILQASPHGIIVSDANGRLILQNKAAETIWAGSATATSMEEWSQYRAFHPDGRPYEPGDWSMARVLRTRQPVEAKEILVQRFDGTYGTLLGSAAPIFAGDGTFEGALAVFSDITRLKEAEEAVRLNADRYRTTLHSIGDAVISTDARGAITYMNPAAEALTRWPLEEAHGRPLSEVFRIVSASTRAVVESPVDKVLRGGTTAGLADHTLLIARDGSEVAIDDIGAPMFDGQRQPAGVVLVFRDVSEQRREEQRRQFIIEAGELLSSSLDFEATLKRVASLAVPTLADWCAVDIAEGDRVTRLAVAHVEPRKVSLATELEARYPSDPESPYGVHEVIRTGKAQLFARIPEVLLVAAAVDEEHLRLLRELGLRSSMTVPLRVRGRVLGAITFVSAESEREFGATDMAIAEELGHLAALAIHNARLYREAQDANRAKDEFLATVSHELRTPLAAMLGWASLLRSHDVTEEKRARGLETIERNAQLQSQLIEDILDVSRIISGQLRIDVRSVDLVAIIKAAVESIQPTADAKGVRVEVDLDAHAARATGDAGRLQQVVWNLVSNAVKFTDREGAVRVRLRRLDSKVEIDVADSGRGIDPTFLPHVFERFRQADSKSTRSAGGLGLGLSIVRELVELHSGTVAAHSAGLRQGSSFKVTLPLAASAPALPVSEAGEALDTPSLDGLRILLVDDEEDARVLLREILERRGAIVRSAGSVPAALAALREEMPDVLVSDIGMPHEDGYSLIKKVRELPNGSAAKLPAAALTAYASTQDRTKSLLAGFQSHVVKPVDPSELIVVVAVLAGRT